MQARASRPALTTPRTRVNCKSCAVWRLKVPPQAAPEGGLNHERHHPLGRKKRIPIHPLRKAHPRNTLLREWSLSRCLPKVPAARRGTSGAFLAPKTRKPTVFDQNRESAGVERPMPQNPTSRERQRPDYRVLASSPRGKQIVGNHTPEELQPFAPESLILRPGSRELRHIAPPVRLRTPRPGPANMPRFYQVFTWFNSLVRRMPSCAQLRPVAPSCAKNLIPTRLFGPCCPPQDRHRRPP